MVGSMTISHAHALHKGAVQHWEPSIRSLTLLPLCTPVGTMYNPTIRPPIAPQDQAFMFLPYNHAMVFEACATGRIYPTHVLSNLNARIIEEDLAPKFSSNNMRRYLVAADKIYRETGYREDRVLLAMADAIESHGRRTHRQAIYSGLWDFVPRDLAAIAYTLTCTFDVE